MATRDHQHDVENLSDDTTIDSFVVLTPTDGQSTRDYTTTESSVSPPGGTESSKGKSLQTVYERSLAAAFDPTAASPRPSSLKLLSEKQSLAVKQYIIEFVALNTLNKYKPFPEINIEALMLGDLNVGITCLASRFIFDIWFDWVENLYKYEGPGWTPEFLLEGKWTKLEIIEDRPSTEYSAETYPRGWGNPYEDARHCEACFLVYDVSNRVSFEAVEWYWQNFMRERARPVAKCKDCHGEACPARPSFQGCVFVLANKIDLPNAEWQVSLQEGRNFADSISPLAHFVPISVKTGENCRSPEVEEMVRRILLRRSEKPPYHAERLLRVQKGILSAERSCEEFFEKRRRRNPHLREERRASARALDKPLISVDEARLYHY